MEPVFENTLRYTAPSHGDWGIVRIASLVPESFMIFICPFACGRHGALGAIDQGFKHRLAYIYITQKDIIEGYDQTLLDGVDEILTGLEKKPKAVMVYVSCLDDLIGTDLDALMDELHEKHPETAFRAGHMNPITMDSAAPPPVTSQDAMFSFLEVSNKKMRNINLIGNLENIDPENELFRAARKACAGGLCHMSDFKSFQGFQKMAQSSHNLVLAPSGLLAAQNMQKKHGIPFLFLPVSYNIEEIAAQYIQFFEFVGAPVPVDFLPGEEAGAIKEIRNTLKAVRERPIVISASAAVRPFSMAEALTIYGFHIEAVVAQEVLPIDRPAFERLLAVKPDIQVIQPEHPEVIRFKNRIKEAIAIGFDAAYITGSEHIVNLSADMRMFGYSGTRALMRMIKDACEKRSDLKKLIDEYGVVI